MIDYVYEVRFPENPDPTFNQKFSDKGEALRFSDQYPGSEVYMLELDYDDYMGTRGIGELVSEVQIRGAEVDAVIADENCPNSCDGDNPDCYDDEGNFRAPEMEDDLEDDLTEARMNYHQLGPANVDFDDTEHADLGTQGGIRSGYIDDLGIVHLVYLTTAEINNVERECEHGDWICLDKVDPASVNHIVKDLKQKYGDEAIDHDKIRETPRDAKPVHKDYIRIFKDMTDAELGEALFSAVGAKNATVTESAEETSLTEEAGIIADLNAFEASLTEAVDEEIQAEEISEEPVEEIPAEETPVATSSKATELIVTLKEASLDFKTLHRHLVGGNWFTIHGLLGDYYERIDELEDSIVENLLSVGVADDTVASEDLLAVKDYEEKEALNIVQEYLDKIQALVVATRDELGNPTTISPALDELDNWIQVEAKYKLTHYFSEPTEAPAEPVVEEPAEAEAPVDEALNEDSAGMVDDYNLDEDEDTCVWCGEAFPVSSLKFDRDLGFLCDRCRAAIMSHEGDDSLDFE